MFGSLNRVSICRIKTLGTLILLILCLTSTLFAATYTLNLDPDINTWMCDATLTTASKSAIPTLDLQLITFQPKPTVTERYSFLCLTVQTNQDTPVIFSECYFTADETPLILTVADWMTESGISQADPTANTTFWTTQWISLSDIHWQSLKKAKLLRLNGKINDQPFSYVFTPDERQILTDYYRDLIENAALKTSSLAATLTVENNYNERVDSCAINEPVVLKYVLTNTTPILRPCTMDANPVEFEVRRPEAPPLYSGTAELNSTLQTVSIAPFSSWHYSLSWNNSSGTANSRATLSPGRYQIRAIVNLASDRIPASLLEPNEVTIQIRYER